MTQTRITLISWFFTVEFNLTQEKVSTGGFSLSKLKQGKYILAIVIIAIVVAAAVTAVFFLPKAAALKVDVGAGPRIRFLGFNVQTPPKDPKGVALSPNNYTKVRQAIAYAVDRDAINTNVFLGLATPIYSMIPPSMPYSQSVFKTKYGAAPNLTLAENLLTSSGYNSSKNGKLYIYGTTATAITVTQNRQSPLS
jgi:ABC-type transport system substrate-binding protein